MNREVAGLSPLPAVVHLTANPHDTGHQIKAWVLFTHSKRRVDRAVRPGPRGGLAPQCGNLPMSCPQDEVNNSSSHTRGVAAGPALAGTLFRLTTAKGAQNAGFCTLISKFPGSQPPPRDEPPAGPPLKAVLRACIQTSALGIRHWRTMLEKVAHSARKAVKLAEPYKPYGGQILEFCSISLSTYQTCMKLTRKSTEFNIIRICLLCISRRYFAHRSMSLAAPTCLCELLVFKNAANTPENTAMSLLPLPCAASGSHSCPLACSDYQQY